VDDNGNVKFTMGNVGIDNEENFTGNGMWTTFPYFGASYGVMSGETTVRSIGNWGAGTVSISMKWLMATCRDGSGSGQIQLFHPNAQYSMTPVFMKKVGDNYVEIGRGTATNSG